jgi:hypothetical protein
MKVFKCSPFFALYDDYLEEKPVEVNEHAKEMERIREEITENITQAYNRYSLYYNLRSQPIYEITPSAQRRNKHYKMASEIKTTWKREVVLVQIQFG